MTTESLVVTRDMEIAAQTEAEVARVSAQELCQAIAGLDIVTPTHYAMMAAWSGEARKRANMLETKRKELTRSLDLFRPAEELLGKGKELASQKMGIWTQKQERLRQHRERKKLREEEALRLKKEREAAEKKGLKLEAKGMTNIDAAAEVVAALQRVLDTAVCDACWEDDSYQRSLECSCRCHRQEYEARQAAQALLAKLRETPQGKKGTGRGGGSRWTARHPDRLR